MDVRVLLTCINNNIVSYVDYSEPFLFKSSHTYSIHKRRDTLSAGASIVHSLTTYQLMQMLTAEANRALDAVGDFAEELNFNWTVGSLYFWMSGLSCLIKIYPFILLSSCSRHIFLSLFYFFPFSFSRIFLVSFSISVCYIYQISGNIIHHYCV